MNRKRSAVFIISLIAAFLYAALPAANAAFVLPSVIGTVVQSDDVTEFRYRVTSSSYGYIMDEFHVFAPVTSDYIIPCDAGHWKCDVHYFDQDGLDIYWSAGEFGLMDESVTLMFKVNRPVSIINNYDPEQECTNWVFSQNMGSLLYWGNSIVPVPGIVPEPCTLLTFGVALAGLLTRIKKH